MPIALVDSILPSLRDTELRVLVCVLRQTHVIGRERAAAWLTHAELCRRTGRASEAVSAAVAALSERGLLDIRDERGNPLFTTRERQRIGGRLFYRVVRTGFAAAGKAKTIESDRDINYRFRKSDPPQALPQKGAVAERAAALCLTDAQQERIEGERQRIRARLASL